MALIIFQPVTLAKSGDVNSNFAFLGGQTGGGVMLASTASAAFPASLNTTNLANDFAAIQAAGGGILVLPKGVVQVAGPIAVGANTYVPVYVVGYGTGTTIKQTFNTDTFVVTTNQGSNIDANGLTFDNFRIQYNAPLSSGAAIRIASGQHINLDRLTFIDCPQMVADDGGLQTSMTRCLGFQNPNGNTTQTGLAAVTIGTANNSSQGIEFRMRDCLLRTTAITNSGKGGNAITFFSMESARLSHLRLEGWQQGVAVIPSQSQARKINMLDVYCEVANNANASGAAFYIAPSGTATVWHIEMVDCAGNCGTQTNSFTGGGLQIDTSASATATVDTVIATACRFNGFTGPGAYINPGSGTIETVQLNGGDYSCNGNTGTGSLRSGVYVHGAVNGVTINGIKANNTSSQFSATQAYGVVFDNSPVRATVSGRCNLVGNNTAAVLLGTVGAGCHIDDALGYNDVGTALNGGTAPLSATSASGCSTPSLGKSQAWGTNVASNTTITIVPSGGASTTMVVPASEDYCTPILDPYDTLLFSQAPSTFNWIVR